MKKDVYYNNNYFQRLKKECEKDAIHNAEKDINTIMKNKAIFNSHKSELWNSINKLLDKLKYNQNVFNIIIG